MSEKVAPPPEPAGEYPYPESLVVVTGLSGSGKNYVNKCLEDMGYFCVDNLPLELVLPLLSRVSATRVGVVLDVRNPDFAGRFPEILSALRAKVPGTRLVFLDASEESLIRRFSETRRRTRFRRRPLAPAVAAQRAGDARGGPFRRRRRRGHLRDDSARPALLHPEDLRRRSLAGLHGRLRPRSVTSSARAARRGPALRRAVPRQSPFRGRVEAQDRNRPRGGGLHREGPRDRPVRPAWETSSTTFFRCTSASTRATSPSASVHRRSTGRSTWPSGWQPC